MVGATDTSGFWSIPPSPFRLWSRGASLVTPVPGSGGAASSLRPVAPDGLRNALATCSRSRGAALLESSCGKRVDLGAQATPGRSTGLADQDPYQASERQAQKQNRVFQNWCLGHGYERADELIDDNWEQMLTFYRYRAPTGGTCEPPTWWSRGSRRCGCVPTRRSDSGRSPTRPPWYGRCCWCPNASSGALTRPSCCRL